MPYEASKAYCKALVFKFYCYGKPSFSHAQLAAAAQLKPTGKGNASFLRRSGAAKGK